MLGKETHKQICPEIILYIPNLVPLGIRWVGVGSCQGLEKGLEKGLEIGLEIGPEIDFENDGELIPKK